MGRGAQRRGEPASTTQGGRSGRGERLARRLDLHAGDTLRLEVQGRVLSLRVADAVRDYTLGGVAVFLDQAAAAKLIELGPAQIYTVATTPATAVEPLVEKLKTLLDAEGLTIESYAQLRGQLDLLIGGIVGACGD